jgi:hypothetical protein
MVDLPNRSQVRFPPEMEPEASREIAAAIDRRLAFINVAELIAISSLARGGDILFQEHVATRGLSSYIVLPFEPPVFVEKSVLGVPTGNWEQRFWHVWNHTPLDHREVLAPTEDPYEACNQRQLQIAQQMSDKIVLVALFGGSTDDAGGTGDLIQRVQETGGQIDFIDTNKLIPSR